MYTWRGEWEPDVRYKPNDIVERDGVGYLCIVKSRASSANAPGIDDPNNSWANYWEKLMDEKTIREDPFHYTETKGVGKPTYHVCIDLGNETALVIFGDLEEQIEARNLTNRLNNAVYRWMVKERHA